MVAPSSVVGPCSRPRCGRASSACSLVMERLDAPTLAADTTLPPRLAGAGTSEAWGRRAPIVTALDEGAGAGTLDAVPCPLAGLSGAWRRAVEVFIVFFE